MMLHTVMLLRSHGMVESVMSRPAGSPPVIASQAVVVRIGTPTCVTDIPMRVRVVLKSAVALRIVSWEIQGRHNAHWQDGTESCILRRWHGRKLKTLVMMMLMMLTMM